MKRKIERWKTDLSAAVKDIGELLSVLFITVGWFLGVIFGLGIRSESLQIASVSFSIIGIVIFSITVLTVKSFRQATIRTFYTDIEE